MSNLSARYTHPERDGISCGTLGRGDISGWARPTTIFQRPEVKGRMLLPYHAVKSLNACEMKPLQGPHKPEPVYFPADSKPDPRLDMGRASVIVDYRERLMAHAVKCRRKTVKAKPEPRPVDLLADCPKSYPDGTKGLVGPEIEREVEPSNDNPLPYDRPCKANGWRK